MTTQLNPHTHCIVTATDCFSGSARDTKTDIINAAMRLTKSGTYRLDLDNPVFQDLVSVSYTTQTIPPHMRRSYKLICCFTNLVP